MLLAVLTICVFHVASGQKPDIVDEIKKDVKPVNAIGYLNCTAVHLNLGATVHWAKIIYNGDEMSTVDLSEDDKVVLQNSAAMGKKEDLGEPKYGVLVKHDKLRTTFILLVRYLLEKDAGDYMCYIKIQNTDHSDWPKKIGTIVVQVAPTINIIGTSVYEAVIGGNLTLSCSAYGVPSPNITWKREDGKELAMGGFQYWGATLVLRDIAKKDQGNHICVADNSVRPPASYTVQIKVFYAPTCRAVQNSVGQVQNRRYDAKLECLVEGHPEPHMSWKRYENNERMIIHDDSNFETDKLSGTQNYLEEMWYTLLVKNVQANDYADYWCTADNKYGSCEAKFTLFETAECQGHNCPSLKTSGSNQIVAYLLPLVFAAWSVPAIGWMLL
ncbi:lachesin-like [Mizuhopecten yessoensis]|uniref:Lachesin n=1 Tax=Mizuhopecten yessoensis TaxID=6573 RepID=A0A210QEN4_MIZYE|nr:lachesin-like [Mizuhopecten yessoensis]OWF47237.1 Lachesin [Mizuhopecten yessoensis]